MILDKMLDKITAPDGGYTPTFIVPVLLISLSSMALLVAMLIL